MASSSVAWTKRWTFILAATGAAVGLGNIWKFPYIAGENGGGAFIAVYLLCIIGIGIPIMISETLLGRAGRANAIVSVRKIALSDGLSPWWALAGAIGVLTGILIMMFYSVVGGWALDYVLQSVMSTYVNASPETTIANFTALKTNNNHQIILHTTFLIIASTIVALGVRKGIGLATEILMPILLLIMIGLVIYSAVNGDINRALDFMFHIDFSALNSGSIIIAMGHAFFTLSVGMGAIITYGAYMPEKACIGRNILAIASMDTVVAILAGLAIFPLVFANDLSPGAGPGLMFETLPLAFGQMPGGQIVGTAFFLLLSIAALTSAFCLIEPSVAWLEQLGVKRYISAIIITLTIWAGGLFCILYGDIFDALDYITSNIMLPLSGLILTIFVGWVLRRVTVRKQLNSLSLFWFNAWYIAVRFIAPAGVIVVFLYNLNIL